MTWIVHRFRSAMLSENLSIFVLGLLRESEKDEWEILNLIDSRYDLSVPPKEFRKLLKSLMAQGYASQECAEGNSKMRITRAGMELLRSLELEYREIVSSVKESTSPAPDSP
jgi:DNA-binding PadR family transcriptional regulator